MPLKRKSAPSRATARKRPAPTRRRTRRIANIDVDEIDSIRGELERLGRQAAAPRWNADPEDVRKSVAKLVLTLIEFIRQLLERQAIRRMDAGTLTAEQTEAVGLALMRLEETVRDIGAQFGLAPEDLNLDLGPVGRLM
ncbi:MAG: gas vesicle protein K [Burkholderiales bacterium]